LTTIKQGLKAVEVDKTFNLLSLAAQVAVVSIEVITN
jgi:hypothetical protein